MHTHQIISKKQVSVNELLKIIGLDTINDIVKPLDADKNVWKLTTVIMFKLIIYCLLESHRLSLRVMEFYYQDKVFQSLAKVVFGKTAHSSISDRLKKMDVRVFERLYEKTRSELSKHFSESYLAKGYNIKRVDSTMLDVFSHLMVGMSTGNNTNKNYKNVKHKVKVTTELTNDFEVSFAFHKDQRYLSEELALKELIESSSHDKKDIIVFDRGLRSRKTLIDFKTSIKFVTRLHEKPRFEVLRSHEVPYREDEKASQDIDFKQDSIVYLYGSTPQPIKEEFRVVEVERREDGKTIYFLTNILDLPKEQIAQIYKYRWDIEVFFRFLKQELNLKNIICHEPNAMKIMLYCTMITAMLILVYKKENDIKSYKIAKLGFVKELLYSIIDEVISDPESLKKFKHNLEYNIQK